jgi:cytochrome c oxidase assembly protein subunit 15
MPVNKRFPAFAWGVLIYNLAVILWGALVRATGSGAGCGGHWPLCNGQALPVIAQAATRIEFTHRMMSGVALIAVVALFIQAWRGFAKGHPARRWATWSLVLILTEALLGAALVLFGYVSKDQSSGRVVSLSLHLINTFALLAALALTARWAGVVDGVSVSDAPRRVANYSLRIWLALGAVVLVAVAGAITALGDTLYPAARVADDFSGGANFLVRLRIIHPALAVVAAAYLVVLVMPWLRAVQSARLWKLSVAVLSLVGLQVLAGTATLLLRAPLAMQLLHLLVADSLWITLVLFASEQAYGISRDASILASVAFRLPRASADQS